MINNLLKKENLTKYRGYRNHHTTTNSKNAAGSKY